MQSIFHALGRSLIRLGRKMSRRERSSPSHAQLEALIEHVAFEFAALEAATKHYESTPLWVFLETSLLHARQLREFYFGRTDEDRFPDSSLFAEDYSAQWRGVRGGLPTTLKASKDAIDKQLAHIARERADPATAQDLGATVVQMRGELRELWQSFLKSLGDQARRQRFVSALQIKCGALGIEVPRTDAS